MENTPSRLQKNPAKSKKSFVQKPYLSIHPTVSLLCLPMPSANASTIITISTRDSWKNPSGEEAVSGMSKTANQTMFMNQHS